MASKKKLKRKVGRLQRTIKRMWLIHAADESVIKNLELQLERMNKGDSLCSYCNTNERRDSGEVWHNAWCQSPHKPADLSKSKGTGGLQLTEWKK